MSVAVINNVIETFGLLSIEEKEYVAEVISKQLIEMKREKLAQRIVEARANLEKGLVKRGTIRDLLEDLEND